jgi:hypothetical protein
VLLGREQMAEGKAQADSRGPCRPGRLSLSRSKCPARDRSPATRIAATATARKHERASDRDQLGFTSLPKSEAFMMPPRVRRALNRSGHDWHDRREVAPRAAAQVDNVHQNSRAIWEIVVTKYIVRAGSISEGPTKISISGKPPGFVKVMRLLGLARILQGSREHHVGRDPTCRCGENLQKRWSASH